jgi:hypothetical protein
VRKREDVQLFVGHVCVVSICLIRLRGPGSVVGIATG